MEKLISVLMVLGGGCVAFACGSSSDGDAASCAPPSYTSKVSTECFSCAKSSCSSEYSMLCAANCNSATGGSGASIASDCLSALQMVGACANSKCTSCIPEQEQQGSSGSASGGGSSHTAGSGSGGSSHAAGSGSGGSSHAAGSGSGGTSSAVTGMACTIGGLGCTFYPAALLPMKFDMLCTSQDGVVSEHCPTEDLNGCCTMGTAETICYYKSIAFGEGDCNLGTFSKTPP